MDLPIFGADTLDVGASTGGFTEVLLSKKAKKIFSVDVGSNQLHEKLINHPKVINIAKTNARYLTKKVINEFVDIIVCMFSLLFRGRGLHPTSAGVPGILGPSPPAWGWGSAWGVVRPPQCSAPAG